MKKNKLIILLVFMALCIPTQALVFHSAPKAQQEKTQAVLKSYKFMVDNDKTYYLKGITENGTVNIEVKALCSALDIDFIWDASKKSLRLSQGDTELILFPGSQQAIVNGRTVPLQTKLKTVKGISLFPARIIAETFGRTVEVSKEGRNIVYKINLKQSIQTAADTEKVGQVTIVKMGISNEADINVSVQEALQQSGLKNRKAVIKALQEQPNTIILLYAGSDIQKLKAHSINADQLEKLNWNFEAYHKAYGINAYELLTDKLTTDEVAVIVCTEPEGLPVNYLTWEGMPKEQTMWLIQYNGKE